MTTDLHQIRQYAAYAVPVAILAVGWTLFVRPTSAEAERLSMELEQLRQRVAAARAQAGSAAMPVEPADDPLKAFDRRVATGDPSGRLFEELSRLAARAGVRVETVENGDEGSAGAGGRASGAEAPDPRLALFPAALKYQPVTLVAEADYAAVGRFLWQLRSLATAVELRRLEIIPPVEPPSEAAPAGGDLRVTLALFAYSRDAAAGAGK